MSTKPRVLLVLDDAKLGAHVASYLGGNGFDASAFKTSLEVFESVQNVRPDAVVASQLLPGMDGVALTQKIQKESTKVKVLLLSAVSSPAGIQDVKKTSNADAVLGRGFKPEHLLKELQRILGLLPPRGTSKSATGAAAAAANPNTPSGGFAAAKPPAVIAPPPPDEAPRRPSQGPRPAIVTPPPMPSVEPDLGIQDGLDLTLESIDVVPPPPASATADVENALKWAVNPGGPAAPIAPAPEHPLPVQAPVTPLEPAWMLSRAFADNVSGGVERSIYLSQGRPIVATSNVPEERIGAILVRKGKLTENGLENLLDASKKTGRRLAELVVQSGAITEEERFAIVAEQYAERILALFAWHEAAIEFTPRPAPAEEIAIQLPTERLLFEGLRRHYDAARLEACLTDPNRVMALLPGAEARLPSLALTPLEHDTFIFVDGKRTLAQVAEVAPVRLEALRILYGGVCLNLLG